MTPGIIDLSLAYDRQLAAEYLEEHGGDPGVITFLRGTLLKRFRRFGALPDDSRSNDILRAADRHYDGDFGEQPIHYLEFYAERILINSKRYNNSNSDVMLGLYLAALWAWATALIDIKQLGTRLNNRFTYDTYLTLMIGCQELKQFYERCRSPYLPTVIAYCNEVEYHSQRLNCTTVDVALYKLATGIDIAIKTGDVMGNFGAGALDDIFKVPDDGWGDGLDSPFLGDVG